MGSPSSLFFLLPLPFLSLLRVDSNGFSPFLATKEGGRAGEADCEKFSTRAKKEKKKSEDRAKRKTPEQQFFMGGDGGDRDR